MKSYLFKTFILTLVLASVSVRCVGQASSASGPVNQRNTDYKIVTNYTNLAAVTPVSTGTRVYLSGVSTPGTEGWFHFVASDMATPDNMTVVAGIGGNWHREFSGAYNAMWIGLHADGVTDDSANLKLALAAVPAGGTLLIPAGTYYAPGTSGHLFWPKVNNVTITGDTNGGTVINTNMSPSGYIDYIRQYSNPTGGLGAGYTLTVKNLTLNGPYTNTETEAILSEGNGGHVIVQNVHTHGFWQGLTNTAWDNTGTPSVTDTTRFDVRDCEFEGTWRNGVLINYGGKLNIYNSYIHDYGQAGTGQYHGIYVFQAVSLDCGACHFDNSTGTGFAIQQNFEGTIGTWGQAQYSKVHECIFGHAVWHGVLCCNTIYSTVTNCDFYNFATAVITQNAPAIVTGCNFSNGSYAVEQEGLATVYFPNWVEVYHCHFLTPLSSTNVIGGVQASALVYGQIDSSNFIVEDSVFADTAANSISCGFGSPHTTFSLHNNQFLGSSAPGQFSSLGRPNQPTVTAQAPTGAVNYTYYVCSIDAAGRIGTPSVAQSISNGTTPPNNIITWNQVTGATGYYVLINDTSHYITKIVSGSTTTYTDTTGGAGTLIATPSVGGSVPLAKFGANFAGSTYFDTQKGTLGWNTGADQTTHSWYWAVGRDYTGNAILNPIIGQLFSPMFQANDTSGNAWFSLYPDGHIQDGSTFITNPQNQFTFGSSALTNNGVNFEGGAVRIAKLGTPSAPTVTAQAPTGAVTYTYFIAARDNSGHVTPASSGTTINNGTTPPNNLVTWTAVPGATSYAVCIGDTAHYLGYFTGTSMTDAVGSGSAISVPTSPRDPTGDLWVDGAIAIGTGGNPTTLIASLAMQIGAGLNVLFGSSSSGADLLYNTAANTGTGGTMEIVNQATFSASQYNLEVGGNSGSTFFNGLLLFDSWSGGAGPRIGFDTSATSVAPPVYMQYWPHSNGTNPDQFWLYNTSSNAGGSLNFGTNNIQRLTISEPGNIGLGPSAASSSYRLEAQGGGIHALSLGQPVISSVTNSGTPGGVTYYYWIVPIDIGGHFGPISAAVNTATSNATLNSSNFNVVTWGAVANAIKYDVLRTTSATLPTSGTNAILVGNGTNVTTLTINDQSNGLSNWVTVDGDATGNLYADASVVTHGFNGAIAAKTSNYSVQVTDYTILIDPTSGNVTATLPDCTKCSGQVFIFVAKNVTHTATLATVNSQNIFSLANTSGATTYSLSAALKSIQVQSDGTQWWAIASN